MAASLVRLQPMQGRESPPTVLGSLHRDTARSHTHTHTLGCLLTQVLSALRRELAEWLGCTTGTTHAHVEFERTSFGPHNFPRHVLPWLRTGNGMHEARCADRVLDTRCSTIKCE